MKRNQIQYLLVGMAVGFLGGITNFLPVFGIRFYPYGNFTIPLYSIIVTYAILRYRLMDINVIIKKTLVYSLTMSIIVCGFILLTTLIEGILQKFFGYTTRVTAVSIAAICGFAFRFVKQRIQTVIDKLFYKASYDYRKQLREFTRSLISIHDPDELSELIVNTIGKAMKIRYCSLMLPEVGDGNYIVRAVIGLDDEAKRKATFENRSYLVRLLKHWKNIIVKEERSLLAEKNQSRFISEMEKVHADISVPLITNGRLTGILNLSNKMSGHMFSDEDMDLLATLADEAAIAIENATLYKKILDVKNYTESILTNMTSGVVTVDLDGKITAANDASRKFVHLKSGWVGEHVSILGEHFSRPILQTLHEHKYFSNYEIQLEGEDRLISLGLSTSILRNTQGEKIGAIMVFNDFSELKQMENEVRRLDRLASLGTLAAGMAHEIKNPLSSIKTFTQLLPEKMDDPEFRRDFLAIAQKEVDRIDYLVNQLLSFARPSKPQFQKADILKVIEESLAIIENQIVKKKIKVTKNFQESPLEVYVDERQMKQVFINITVNAIQAMEEGSLTIATRASQRKMHRGEEAEFLQILITDTGKGIPEDQMDKLFNPFFTTKHDGTGLGLAIVHRIIEDHHGFIEVTSKLGRGTTFTINLPMAEAVASQSDSDIRSKEKGYGFGLGKTA